MPEISLFYGIKITMNPSNDHNPPHFHAMYNGVEIAVRIDDCCVLVGEFPRKQLRLVIAWAELHQDELMQNWELGKSARPLMYIDGLR